MVSLVATLQHHTDEVNCCAFSPSRLATSSGDKTVRVYDTADFSELPFSPLSGHGYAVHCCCFSACGAHLLSCSTDGLVLVWSSETGELTARLEHPGRSPLRVCALASDSSLLLAGACDGTMAQWDFSSRTLRRCSAVSEASVVACCFSPCNQMFVTGCTHGDIKLWDTDLKLLLAEKNAHDLGVTCCSFAPRFNVVLRGFNPAGFLSYQVESCFQRGCLPDRKGAMHIYTTRYAGSIEFQDGCCVEFRLASCGQDSRVNVWSLTQRDGSVCALKLLHTLTSQSAPVSSCAFSSDGELVISGSVDKSVAIYDANQGTLLHTLTQHDRYVTAVAFSPIMPWVATGSMDRSVKVWRIGDVSSTEAESRQTTCQERKLPGYSARLFSDWSEEDVQAWLREEGLQDLIATFTTHNIDGAELSRLNKDTAAELGIESLGLRSRLMRKIEALKAEESGSGPPDEFLCPITRELMKDPVIAADGYSYERTSIQSWLSGKNKTSPMTNLPLQTTILTPNRSLKTAIRRWELSQ